MIVIAMIITVMMSGAVRAAAGTAALYVHGPHDPAILTFWWVSYFLYVLVFYTVNAVPGKVPTATIHRALAIYRPEVRRDFGIAMVSALTNLGSTGNVVCAPGFETFLRRDLSIIPVGRLETLCIDRGHPSIDVAGPGLQDV